MERKLLLGRQCALGGGGWVLWILVWVGILILLLSRYEIVSTLVCVCVCVCSPVRGQHVF